MENEKKYSFLTFLSLVFLICIPIFCFLPALLGSAYRPKYYFMWYRPIVMNISYLPLICSMLAMAHIKLNKQRKGFVLSSALCILSIFSQFILYESFYPTNRRVTPNRILCATGLHGIGTSFTVMKQDAWFENKPLVIPADWCDYLLLHGDISPRSLYCGDSGAKEGESGYAINRHVTGMAWRDLPSDIVILFESDLGKRSKKIKIRESRFYDLLPEKNRWYYQYSSPVRKDRWNQAGSPEDVVVDRHLSKGANILFADGHVEFVEAERISNLRWTVQDEESR